MSEQQSPAEQQPTENVPDLNNELKARREKLALLREAGNAFPNDFRRDSISDDLHAQYGEKTNVKLDTATDVLQSHEGRLAHNTAGHHTATDGNGDV